MSFVLAWALVDLRAWGCSISFRDHTSEPRCEMFKYPVHASVICDTSVHFIGMQAHESGHDHAYVSAIN